MTLQPIQGEIKITRVNQGVLEPLLVDLTAEIIALQENIIELTGEMQSANALLLSSLTHQKYANDLAFAEYNQAIPPRAAFPAPPVTVP